MAQLTLLRQGNALADPAEQITLLEQSANVARFDVQLQNAGCEPLRATGIDTLQVNLGKICNQTCTHCHVDAGPDRTESMSGETVEACLALLRRAAIKTLDITGGAPEMNPHFRHLVTSARALGCHVIDRCNLTILVTQGYTDLPQFLAEHEVDVVASLPCYLESNVDRQRGDRVFQRSLEAIRRLNALGFGVPGGTLRLNLVFNPAGPSLPPPQAGLEADYRRELKDRYDIRFSQLYTITNMPISRFLADLAHQGRFEEYMQTLVKAFNPMTVESLMCRSLVSVDWQGNLYDCDFNQMLNLKIGGNSPRNVHHLSDEDLARLHSREVVTGQHCFGCTAGSGSSCQGSLTTGSDR
ncbi:MAG: arsenosugar biosynthesis radical SAM protein ArsS [Planctomycetaceae bacterium]|nr:arsenosugar biosynthesis radical SAM protein ArsS [Planctomycetaceae bacterium]